MNVTFQYTILSFLGFYLRAKVEKAADDTIYECAHHIIGIHTHKYPCAVMVYVYLTLMLAKRDIITERNFYLYVTTWF